MRDTEENILHALADAEEVDLQRTAILDDKERKACLDVDESADVAEEKQDNERDDKLESCASDRLDETCHQQRNQEQRASQLKPKD